MKASYGEASQIQQDPTDKQVTISPKSQATDSLGGSDLLGKAYSKGVTKVTWHWNYARVYLSKSVIRAYGKTGEWPSRVLSYLPGQVAMYAVHQLYYSASTIPGGVYFDINYLSLGIGATTGFAGIAISVLESAATGAHWQ